MPSKFYKVRDNPKLANCKNARKGSFNPYNQINRTNTITNDPYRFKLQVVLCSNRNQKDCEPKDMTCVYHSGSGEFGKEVNFCEFYNESISEIEREKEKLKARSDDMKQSMFSEKDMTG